MKKFYNHNRLLLGTLGDDGVFRKTVSAAKHLLRYHDGKGLQVPVMVYLQEISSEGLHEKGCWGLDEKVVLELPVDTEIRIRDKDDGTVYYSTVKNFRKGSRIEYGSYGSQLVLWRGFFDQKVDGVTVKSPYTPLWAKDLDFWDEYRPQVVSDTILKNKCSTEAYTRFGRVS